MIHQVVKKYDFSKVEWTLKAGRSHLDPTFVAAFRAVPAQLAGLLVDCGGAFNINVSDKAVNPYWDYGFDQRQQNYLSYTGEDGTCRVIEASLFMDVDFRAWKVGFPLTLCGDQNAEHEFVVYFDGVWLSMLCDGIVMDREAPEGTPRHSYECDGGLRHDIISDAVHDYRVSNRTGGVSFDEIIIDSDAPMQYYTPYGFNSWVGDVATFSWGGRLHVFYLYDRHHHCTRRGKGAHAFAHISTADFVEWTDHGLIFDLDRQWQSMGTGNPFEYDGKLCLAFGWHTERARQYYERSTFLFREHLARTGDTGEFSYDQLGKLTPAGATYAISDDGVNFRPSNVVMHYLTNPSIYNRPDGKLWLLQDAIWESDHPGSWKVVKRNFPPNGRDSFSHNSLECPNLFKLNGWQYLMIGFVGFFGRKDEDGAQWQDFTEKGWEPYDGACVPMATVHNGRVIEGSWLNGIGWGSCLLLREMIPLGDNGRVGKRFLEEALPKFTVTRRCDGTADISASRLVNRMLEMTVTPAMGDLDIVFTGDGASCRLRWMPGRRRAQWSAADAPELPTLREQVLMHPTYTSMLHFNNIHRGGRDYAREELCSLEGDFRLRIMIHADPKMNSVVLDAEFGGKHTMLSLRNDMRHVDGITVTPANGQKAEFVLKE